MTSTTGSPAPTFGIVGGLALDNVVTAEGRVILGRPGGNTLWASLGAALFCRTREVGIVARAGEDYPAAALDVLAGCGVRLDGVRRIPGPHRLRIAYQHLADGRRLQPVPADVLAILPVGQRAAFTDSTIDPAARRDGDPHPDDIPADWIAAVRAWHVPLVPMQALTALVERLAPTGALLVADCPNRHEVKDFVAELTPVVRELDVFSPSTSDLDIIAPGADAQQLCAALVRETGTPVILKCGPAGVCVMEPDRPVEHVPPVPTTVEDPTGAGDAFCGAFLVRYAGGATLLDAARSGAVAAAHAVAADRIEQLAAVVKEQQ